MYVWKDVFESIYHINNPASPFSIGSGNDNRFCGHVGWPCINTIYAIRQGGIYTTNKVGIVNGVY
jgi:hypothetical protein